MQVIIVLGALIALGPLTIDMYLPALPALQDDLGVTVRCIPLPAGEPGTCPFTGQPSAKRVVWAKAY